MAEPRPLADADARARIHTDLTTTLFVEAGAGSGKTTALVDRVVQLVRSGTSELRSIAAITFTEKAGAELRARVRAELERWAMVATGDELEVCTAALDQLDGAAIGTLHAFAQRILSEHPVEAGLPPRLEVLDEVSSGVEFERRWAAFQDELLEDPALERTILLLLAATVRPTAFKVLARAFDQNWDLVEERVDPGEPEPPAVHLHLERALVAVDALCARRADCERADDKLCLYLDEVATGADHLRAIEDELELLDALQRGAHPDVPRFKPGGKGTKGNWPGVDLGELRDEVRTIGDELFDVRNEVASRCARHLGAAVRAFTLRAAQERREAGRLEFHDLLVLARALLRDPRHGPAVRRALHERYTRLLLDEFQDTDPIQIELAVRIAAAHPEDPDLDSADWVDVDVAPGHLFVVGDPKQSIYRFRRADIAMFLAAADRYGPEAGGVIELTTNFRTVEPVITWVNHTFAALMAADVGEELPIASQPAYLGLDRHREVAPTGPPVAVIGRHAQGAKTSADDLRRAEADEVVATVRRALAEGWSVHDGTDEQGLETWRPTRLGDITILVPARTSLPFLEDRLDAGGIAYRAESSSLVYATRAVRDLLMVLRAADDSTDHLRIVAALRTPLFGCGDDDLFRFRVERDGRWSYLADQPDTVPPDDPVRMGLAGLRALHRDRRWHSPSELLDRIARDRRAFELGFAEGRPRDVWRRLRFVIDQARAWSDATGGGLREYLAWVAQQTSEGARVAEAVLPETDDDAVRIMTIHAAKGLEFPITIVSGLSTVPQARLATAEVAFPPGSEVAYRFGAKVRTREFEEWQPIDEQMGYHERIRLLYVATTRARDHLVVSLHRKERPKPPAPAKRTNAELLVDGMGAALDALPDAVAAGAGPAEVPATAPVEPPAPFEQWAAERAAALAHAARPTTVAATALTDGGDHDPVEPEVPVAEVAPAVEPAGAGLEKRPRDLDLPPWLKGRYGTAVGRAVHAVLQTVDLAAGPDELGAAAAAQCEAEAIPDRAELVRRLAADALASPVVRAAAGAPRWREVYACTPVDGGRLLEGYIDLLYRSPDGLVVVDYKTAATDDRAELDRRVEGYRLQGAAYALTVGAATGEDVVRVVFLFLTPHGAVERELTGLDAAIADVRRLVQAGEELVVA